MTDHPRVALFADTFHETNGAANVLRRLKAFASDTSRELLTVCAGNETKLDKDGPAWTLELRRSRVSFPIDGDLKYDPLLWRHWSRVKRVLADFRPNIIHITGLNDISQLGFYFAHFGQINAVASWHTNTHEYVGRRLASAMSWLPRPVVKTIATGAERLSFRGLMTANFIAQMQLAPNEDLVELLQKETKRPAALMSRGVDTELFNPSKRRREDISDFVLGFVGRLRPEKNVRFLAKIDSQMKRAGLTGYKWLIVGEGGEDDWLRSNLSNAQLTGVLHGEELAMAYANMDLFVFPSKTDAFGNVVLEGMASGVPAVVMSDNGPKFLIKDSVDGFIASDDKNFIEIVTRFAAAVNVPPEISNAARTAAEARSWPTVFEQLYRDYKTAAGFAKNVRAQSKLALAEERVDVQEQVG